MQNLQNYEETALAIIKNQTSVVVLKKIKCNKKFEMFVI